MLHGDDLTAHHLPPPTHRATERLGVTATALDVDRRSRRPRRRLDPAVRRPGDRDRLARPAPRGQHLRADAPQPRRRDHAACPARAPPFGRRRRRWSARDGDGVELPRRGLPGDPGVTRTAVAAPARPVPGRCLRDRGRRAQARPGRNPVGATRRDGAATQVMLDEGTVVEADVRRHGSRRPARSRSGLPPAGCSRAGCSKWTAGAGLRPGPRRRGGRGSISHPPWRPPGSAVDQRYRPEQGRRGGTPPGDEALALDFRPYFWTEQFGLTLKAAGFLPLASRPAFVDGDGQAAPR